MTPKLSYARLGPSLKDGFKINLWFGENKRLRFHVSPCTRHPVGLAWFTRKPSVPVEQEAMELLDELQKYAEIGQLKGYDRFAQKVAKAITSGPNKRRAYD